MITVDIQYATDSPSMPDAGAMNTWARTALHGLHADAELTVRIVGRDEGMQLNERWRNSQGATNVLSFPALLSGTAADICHGYIGDIVLCAPVVQEEALLQGKDPKDHWAHLVIHGILHLIGYDHVEPGMAEEMELLEIRILTELGICNPYIITE